MLDDTKVEDAEVVEVPAQSAVPTEPAIEGAPVAPEVGVAEDK